MKFGFGVDLGGTTVKLAYFDEAGTMLDKWEIPTDISENGKNILPDIAKSINAYLEEKNISREDIIGVGIGVPGAVNNKGIVAGCDNLGWGHFSVKDVLEPLVGVKVVAGNDATVAALGECWKGGGQGYKSMVLVTLGTGVVADEVLAEVVSRVFDFRPAAIIDQLGLRAPIYRNLAAYGHIGREDLDVAWEKTDRVEALKAALSDRGAV